MFDRTAPELWRVACYLAGDHHLAEDALQATFLAAIEHREQWDAGQRVLPWLLGLLANRVREARRKAGRSPDVARLDVPRQLDPREATEQGELRSAFKEALVGISEPYRTVVEQHLVHGKAAHEIAGELGVRGGTVRMRLHRGIEQLRRRLPEGVSPALFALPELSGETLATMRRLVLNEAAHLAPAGSVASASAWTGTVTLQRATAALVSVALATIGIVAVRTWTAPATTPELHVSIPGPVAGGSPGAPELVDSNEQQRTRVTATSVGESSPRGWREGLAVLTGRVVAENGTPVPDLRVSLFEGDARLWMPSDRGGWGSSPPELIVAEARTDADGHFRIEGGYDAVPHALGVDLRGPRAELLRLDVTLRHGAVTDLGDVPLRAGRTLLLRGMPNGGDLAFSLHVPWRAGRGVRRPWKAGRGRLLGCCRA